MRQLRFNAARELSVHLATEKAKGQDRRRKAGDLNASLAPKLHVLVWTLLPVAQGIFKHLHADS